MKHIKTFENFNSYNPIDLPKTGFAAIDGEEENPFVLTEEDWEKYPFYSGIISFYIDGDKLEKNQVYKAILDLRDINLQKSLKNLIYEFGGDYYKHKDQLNELVEDLIFARKTA
jgi:hypothetical protein